MFARAELPPVYTDDQRERFERGQGGTLTPKLCVDKLPAEIGDFDALVAESEHTGIDWDMVFVAGLSGQAGHAPNTDQTVQPLKLMLQAIHSGKIAQFMVFDRRGDSLQFG